MSLNLLIFVNTREVGSLLENQAGHWIDGEGGKLHNGR